MRNKDLLFVTVFILCGSAATAQDIHFSQYQQTHLMTNPSATGFDFRLNSALLYRNQWRAVTDPYQTSAAFADFALTDNEDKSFWGVGAFIYNDVAGEGKMGAFQ